MVMTNPMADRWASVVLLAVLPIAACAGRNTEVTTYRLAVPAARSWVGASVADVIKRWGASAQKTSDGEGGTILTYRSTSSVQVTGSVRERKLGDPSQPVSGIIDMATPSFQVAVPQPPSAVFYVSPKGIVYRYSIDASLLNSGKAPDAPPPAPASEP